MKNIKQIETIKAYSRMGEKYIKNVENFIPPKFLEFLEIIPRKGRVLDVGCAGGSNAKKLADKGFEVIGIDLVDKFLDYSKKNVPEAEFKKMDVLNLDFFEDSFDAILANAILLHLEKEDIILALKNLHKVLKSKGKIFISVKMGRGTSYEADKLSNEKRMLVYYEKDEIEEIIQQVGFRVIFSNICDDVHRRKGLKWIIVFAEKTTL